MELDCRGMRCPIPIIKLAHALKTESAVKLLSDDPATLPDLTAWARMTGNELTQINIETFDVNKGD
jgi:tRNA 2-thiouridine synthesizing protein A